MRIAHNIFQPGYLEKSALFTRDSGKAAGAKSTRSYLEAITLREQRRYRAERRDDLEK